MSKLDTYYLDLDGTCVKHFNNIEDYLNQPQFLEGVIDYLLSLKPCHFILTTGRSKENAEDIVQALKVLGIVFDHELYCQATGSRTVINDDDYEGNCKAFAIRHKRNDRW